MYWTGWPLTPPLALTQSKYALVVKTPSVKSVPGFFVAIPPILIGVPVGFSPLPLPHFGLSTTDPLLLLLLPLPPHAATTNDRPAATTTSAVTDRPLFEPKYLFTDLSSSGISGPSGGPGDLGGDPIPRKSLRLVCLLFGRGRAQIEQSGGVLLEDQRPDLVVDLDALEVPQPALGRDHREVQTEQNLPFEQGVRVADELRREVLGRPAGEVDVDLWLVHRDRDRLVLPGEGGLGKHDRQLGKIGRHVVHVDRVRVLQPHPAAAREAGADAAVPGVKEGGEAGFRDHLIQRIDVPVVREERLQVGVELEPADVVGVDQPAGTLDGVGAGRVDACEGDEDVGVAGSPLQDLLVRDRRAAGLGLP